MEKIGKYKIHSFEKEMRLWAGEETGQVNRGSADSLMRQISMGLNSGPQWSKAFLRVQEGQTSHNRLSTFSLSLHVQW